LAPFSSPPSPSLFFEIGVCFSRSFLPLPSRSQWYPGLLTSILKYVSFFLLRQMTKEGPMACLTCRNAGLCPLPNVIYVTRRVLPFYCRGRLLPSQAQTAHPFPLILLLTPPGATLGLPRITSKCFFLFASQSNALPSQAHNCHDNPKGRDTLVFFEESPIPPDSLVPVLSRLFSFSPPHPAMSLLVQNHVFLFPLARQIRTPCAGEKSSPRPPLNLLLALLTVKL